MTDPEFWWGTQVVRLSTLRVVNIGSTLLRNCSTSSQSPVLNSRGERSAKATGFQIPAYAAGAGQVILVVGAQKVVADLDTAMRRLDSYVLPLEDARAMAAYGVPSATNRVLVLNGEPFGRVTVLLLRETIGY